MFFVESPARSDEGIEDARRLLVPLVFSRGKLVDGDLSGALPQCFYLQDRPVDFGLPKMRFERSGLSRDHVG
jgi:hypothetical protein